MTTGYTPPTIPSVRTGTPPREWSESILASNVTKDTPATLPGGLERVYSPDVVKEEEPRGESQQAPPSDESKPTGTTSDQPSIATTVDYATQTAAIAASYIPQGVKDTVSSYSPSGKREEGPNISLPSSELKGAQPLERTGGVGALPGNLSESSVALLPDEREERAQERQPTPPRHRRDTIKPSTVGGDDEAPESQEREETKISGDAARPGDESVASQPTDTLPISTEVATDKTTDSSIATSRPDVESQNEASETESWAAGSEQGKAAVVAATGMVGTAREKLGGKAEDIEGSDLASEKDKSPLQDIREEGNEEGQAATTRKHTGGYGGEYHPAQLHPPPPGASAAEYQTSVGVQQADQHSPTTKTGVQESLSTEKKPGFMTMVRGEMKILAGRMSGDELKVEEGKRIVHGGA